MKAMKSGLRVFGTLLIFSIWIGLLYPELALPKDSYRIVFTDASEEEREAWEEEEDVFWKILNLDREQIHFKSFFWERLWKR